MPENSPRNELISLTAFIIDLQAFLPVLNIRVEKEKKSNNTFKSIRDITVNLFCLVIYRL